MGIPSSLNPFIYVQKLAFTNYRSWDRLSLNMFHFHPKPQKTKKACIISMIRDSTGASSLNPPTRHTEHTRKNPWETILCFYLVSSLCLIPFIHIKICPKQKPGDLAVHEKFSSRKGLDLCLKDTSIDYMDFWVVFPSIGTKNFIASTSTSIKSKRTKKGWDQISRFATPPVPP
jgi:hypothetical protein